MHAPFNCLQRILDRLNPLENDRAWNTNVLTTSAPSWEIQLTIPIILEQLKILPGVTDTREHDPVPLRCRVLQIIIRINTVLFLVLFAEDGVAEPNSHSRGIRDQEGIICVGQIRRSPT